MPRLAKRLIVGLSDLCLCVLTVWLAYYLRIGEFVSLSESAIFPVAASIALSMPLFFIFGFYRAIFRYSNWSAILTIARACLIYGLIYGSIFTVGGISGVPRTIGIIQPILLFLFVAGTRISASLLLGTQFTSLWKTSQRQRVLIYGAGKSGRQLADAMANNLEMRVVGFLDDNSGLQGRVLNGLPVYSPSNLAALVKTLTINVVLLAIPSVSRSRRNEILSQISNVKVSVRTLPSVSDLAQGKVSVSDIYDLELDDLLGREPVVPDKTLLAKTISQKTVLVTGAGGSIGGELCRQIAMLQPKKLLLVEQSEFALYNIHQELESAAPETLLVPLLASVQDIQRISDIMSTFKPETVYHAAAYKHVPLVEHNVVEGFNNNVFGTLNTVNAAIKYKVNHFVLVSTDKAVRPTNIMGVSKRLAELILQALSSEHPATVMSMVRFGNVLGSSGSVVPKFRQQIQEGGPVTITHPEITRYFMTIPEAAQLVIQSGAIAKGGDVFVLDMGKPVRIIDLARKMIELSGRTTKDQANPEGEIELKFTNLRPGEKLHEELFIEDNPESTSHSRIMRAQENYLSWDVLEKEIKLLDLAIEKNDLKSLKLIVERLIPDYQTKKEVVDWIYREKDTLN